MSPRRENHFGNNASEDNVQPQEEDGWRLGYDVELNGVGFLHAAQGGSEDESSFVDSEAESGVDTVEFSQHLGYSLLQLEESAADNFASSSDSDDFITETEHFQGNTEVETKDEHVVEADNPSRELGEGISLPCEAISGELIPHQPIDIILDDEKVEIIRAAMSSFSLPTPPQWPSLNNVQLSNIVKEKLQK